MRIGGAVYGSKSTADSAVEANGVVRKRLLRFLDRQKIQVFTPLVTTLVQYPSEFHSKLS